MNLAPCLLFAMAYIAFVAGNPVANEYDGQGMQRVPCTTGCSFSTGWNGQTIHQTENTGNGRNYGTNSPPQRPNGGNYGKNLVVDGYGNRIYS